MMQRGGVAKKKTKMMQKGGAMKKTKYMAKGGMKKTMGYARGGAARRKQCPTSLVTSHTSSVGCEESSLVITNNIMVSSFMR